MAETRYEALERYTRALTVALGYKDLYTRIHSERVMALAESIAARLGLDEQELGLLRVAAAFHDVGKIGVPDQILLKPGKLDEDELEQIQKHSKAGADIILATELEGAEDVALAILHHHEHFDGNGYPAGLSGTDIPLASRIISVADSYDAMALTRSYHPPKRHSEIMEILDEESGNKHDPAIIDLLVEIIENSPFRAAS